MKNLDEEIFSHIKRNKQEIPEYITDNIRLSFRPYQEQSLHHFLFYETDEYMRTYPAHLLFHMATGSGKTLIMAALILHLYKQGYSNFLFFVNSSNIIEKTKENFLNPTSSKYLFTDSIEIDGKRVRVREVNNFDGAAENNINIHFTTIQGLHIRLNDIRENAISYDDFEDKKVVMISDEAHHINTLTKTGKLSASEGEYKASWEYTVQNIFKQNKDNFLLDFTATMDLENANIREKYADKRVCNYPLSKFRLDGYSKDIELRQTQATIEEKMFHAVIFSQYRRKLAEKKGLQIKPVIMMKSENVTPSKDNTKNFIKLINSLTPSYIQEVMNRAQNDPDLRKMFDYFFDELKLSYDNFILEIKEDFSSEKIINVNDNADLESYQIKVNSLEDYNNEIRVVFAVNKLNEGWDVLNLFDIVRLYDTRDAKSGAPGKTTMAEAQLIGRGARYCPFVDPDVEEVKEKRKYDKDVENPLRILEELYYHCSHNPRYISEIKTALQKTGIMGEPEKIQLELKETFKKTDFYKNGVVYINKKVKNENRNKKSLKNYNIPDIYVFPRNISGMVSTESALTEERKELGTAKLAIKQYRIEEKFDRSTLRRVADGLKFYYFDNIKEYLPHLESMNSLFDEIGNYAVEIKGDKDRIFNLSRKEKKEILHFVLSEIEAKIKSGSTKYEGSKEFFPEMVSKLIKEKKVQSDGSNPLEAFDEDWYVYKENVLNGLEKEFVDYIIGREDDIREKYDEFYLIRNERQVKLYNFKDGKGFEPDFLFLLINKEKKKNLAYQLFIEPKGEHIYEGDKWKELFLKQLRKDHKIETLYSTIDYDIVGFPFYRDGDRSKFKKEFQNFLEE